MTPGACVCINEQPIRCPPGHPGPWASAHSLSSSCPKPAGNSPQSSSVWNLGVHCNALPSSFLLTFSSLCPSLFEEYLLPHDSLQRLLMATNGLIFSIIFQQETTKGWILISGFKNTWQLKNQDRRKMTSRSSGKADLEYFRQKVFSVRY